MREARALTSMFGSGAARALRAGGAAGLCISPQAIEVGPFLNTLDRAASGIDHLHLQSKA